MEISSIFKQVISDTFYDKNMEIWEKGSIKDDEGCVIGTGKTSKISDLEGNFQFSTREKIRQEYGENIKANAIVTCDTSLAEIGNILVYNSKDYEIKAVVPYDSHTTILVEGDENG